MTHNSVISKALAYSINYEQYLRTSLSGPRVPMNNNIAEQAIRLFTIGRKYFIFTESYHSAKTSAVLYNLLEFAVYKKLSNFNCMLTI